MVVSRKKRPHRRSSTIRSEKKMVGAGSRMSCLREPSPVREPMTNDSIRLAVAMWKTDRPQANLEYGYICQWNVSNVTNMSSLFGNRNFRFSGEWSPHQFNPDIGRWDVSRVTDMSHMFGGAEQFNKDISQWNTGNVTNMAGMFEVANKFNKDIGGWDTSKVTNMRSMFNNAKQFNKDIGGWDTSNVTNMRSMFEDAKQFNKDIGGWDTSNVTNMSYMFEDARKFNADISRWNTGKVTDMSKMFRNAKRFNKDISQWDIGKVINMHMMFDGETNFDISNIRGIRGWDIVFNPFYIYPRPTARAAPAVRDRVLSRFVDYGEHSGVAFEVHNIFRKMNKSKYINHLMTFFNELPLEQRDDIPFIISGSGNLTFNYWDPTKMKNDAQVAFNHYISDKSDREKESEMKLFNSVFGGITRCRPDEEVKQLTNLSLAYMWSSDWSDDERALYIYKMINDNAEAYAGNYAALNVSCIQGIFERFILGIRDMIQIKTDTTPFQIELFSIITNQILEPDKVYELWREEVKENPQYDDIKNIISKRDNNEDIVFDDVDAVALKKSYSDFMKTKYEEIITDEQTLNDKMNENQIKQFIDYVPVQIQDGGRKKKKSKKHNTKKKKGRKNNTKKKRGKNVS